MPDGMDGASAVIESPVVDTQENFSDEPSSSITDKQPITKEANTPADDKLDGRKQPDPLRKRIASLRSQAESVTDPAEKAALLADAKALNDKVGKVGAYESLFPTVREVREVKALLDTVGADHGGDWKTGLQTMQQRIGEARQIDQQLEAGDPAVVQKIWDEAPEGVPKIMPALLDKFAESKPAEYQKLIAGHTVKFLDTSGFPSAFDQMVQAYESGDKVTAARIKEQMIRFVAENRAQATTQPKVDPEVERLRNQLKERETKDVTAANQTALKAVESHSLPILETKIKAIVGKLGLSPDQIKALTTHAWNDLQDTRNADSTYKTITTSRYQSGGATSWAEYAKGWTNDNAEVSARKVANLYYGHQLRNGAVAKPNPTAAVTPKAGIVQGQQPSRDEIDYSQRGVMAARKAGFRDLADMLMAGQAPLKVGGVRKWK